jgi:hypothetical protein
MLHCIPVRLQYVYCETRITEVFVLQLRTLTAVAENDSLCGLPNGEGVQMIIPTMLLVHPREISAPH